MSRPLAVLVPEIGVISETFLDWDVNEFLTGGTAVVADPHGADLSVRLSDRSRRFACLAGVMVPTWAAAWRLVRIGLAPEHIHVVANHVAVPGEPGPPSSAGSDDIVRCLTVGRLVEKKGHRALLHSLRPRVRVGPSLAARRDRRRSAPQGWCRLVDRLDLHGAVRLQGAQLPDAVARATVGRRLPAPVRDRRRRGRRAQPLAVLPAMAGGRPAVLTRHEGLPEIIDDRRNGWLVDEHAVPEFAAAIRELATDPALRTAIGCAA